MGFQVSMVQAIVAILALAAFAPTSAAILAIALLYCLSNNYQGSVGGSLLSTESRIVIKLESENASVIPNISVIRNEVCLPKLVLKAVICHLSLSFAHRWQQQQLACPLFAKTPAEVRNQIYDYLLKSKRGRIKRPDLLLLNKRSGVVYQKNKRDHDAPDPDPGIDATILRTCRKIYYEALPILYLGNTFYFWYPAQIDTFKLDGIVKTPGEWGLVPGSIFVGDFYCLLTFSTRFYSH